MSLKLPAFPRPLACFLILILLFSHLANAAVNVTIDDEKGDSKTGAMPVYYPADAWVQGSTCTSCFVKPDPAQVHDGTWHTSTTSPNGGTYTTTIQFSGTAVYTYFVLANKNDYTATLSNLSFQLNNNRYASFVHTPYSVTELQYNVLCFRVTGLTNTDYTLTMYNNGGPNSSLAIFDYAIYTTDDDTTTTTAAASSSSGTSSTSEATIASSSSQNNPSSDNSNTQTSLGSMVESTYVVVTSGATVTYTVDLSPSLTAGTAEGPGSGTPSPNSDASSSTSGSNHVGAIVGGSIAGVIVLLLALLLCRRHPRVKAYLSRNDPVKPVPFMDTRRNLSNQALNTAEEPGYMGQYSRSPFGYWIPGFGNADARRKSLAGLKTNGLDEHNDALDTHRNNRLRPPTYIPSRQLYISPIATGKMSELSPLPSASPSSPSETPSTRAFLGHGMGGIHAPYSLDAYRQWQAGIPSVYGEEAPPRYDNA